MVTMKDKLATASATFQLQKLTKGAYRYDEVSSTGTILKSDIDGALIGGLYLRKLAMNQHCMKKFKITIEELPAD